MLHSGRKGHKQGDAWQRPCIGSLSIGLLCCGFLSLPTVAQEEKASFSTMFVPVEEPPIWWKKCIFATRLYGEDQEQHAMRFYKEALDDARKAKVPERILLALTYYYANTKDSPDALPIYVEGAKEAETQGCKAWQAKFLQAQGIAQRYLVKSGKRDSVDPAPLLKALEIKPGDPAIPTAFRAECYQSLAEIYRSKNELDNCEKYTKLALSEFEQLGDKYYQCADLTCEMSLLRFLQGKEAEAIKLLAESCKMYPSRTSWYTRQYVSTASENDKREIELKTTAKALFSEKKFAELDTFVEKTRASKEVLPFGTLPADIIYDHLGIENKSEDECKKQIAIMREWIKTIPSTATGRILLADTLRDYAWRARGSGYANTVTKEGWALMEQRINEAWSLLQSIKTRPADWYNCAASVSLGRHLSKPEYEALVSQSRMSFPYSDGVLFAQSYWLQPKWFGEPGDAEQLINAELKKRTAIEADVFYARIICYLDALITDPTGRSDFDWTRMKRGLEEIIKRYPNSGKAKARLLAYALRANDKATLQALGVK